MTRLFLLSGCLTLVLACSATSPLPPTEVAPGIPPAHMNAPDDQDYNTPMNQLVLHRDIICGGNPQSFDLLRCMRLEIEVGLRCGQKGRLESGINGKDENLDCLVLAKDKPYRFALGTLDERVPECAGGSWRTDVECKAVLKAGAFYCGRHLDHPETSLPEFCSVLTQHLP